VRVETVKSFEEPMGAAVERRIGALKPGYYTHIGPAVRHAAAELAGQPQRKKLLLVLTEGKPHDIDHYEGRFAVEDTRKAVRRPGGRALRCSASPSTPALNPSSPRRSGAAAMPSSATSVVCRRSCRRSTGNWRDETGQNSSMELQISINR
jgi:nitric oxide reductase NorD protein